MEQNENNKIGTAREENAATTQASHEDNAATTQMSHEEMQKKLKKQRIRQIIASLIGVAILAFGLWKIVCLFLDYNANETSNDAQVEQYISPVNLRASGYIAKVCFKEHEEVHKGDTLLILDDREYRIRLMEAEAALKDAKAGANVIDATQQTTQTSATVYSASIDEIEVRLAKLAKDCERYRNLVEKKAATPIQLEQLEVEYAATKKKLESVKRQQAAAYKGVNEVVTRKQNVAAAIERAEAAVEMAKLNLSYCVVVAPCDGKLGRRSIEEGQMVNAGTTITYILPNAQKWVIANYKETQVENLYVGQKVRISVDAMSNKEFEGTVTAISGATGSKYSLVPTDNSAGNFVKIQQRVPVRIDFNHLSKEDNARLAAGMMVIVKAERKSK
jgi:membrane fusion protein (multidrug efflux system)